MSTTTLPEICRDSTVVDTTLQLDGDIAGLGVRLSFYLQTFILVFLVIRSPDDAPGSLWILTATSCGLTVAAIVRVATQILSLLEAIVVSQLVWLANFASLIAIATYSRNRGPDSLVKIVTVGQGYISMILTIVMWRYADKIGPYPECNRLVKFVLVFAVDVPVLGSGRTASLVCASIVLYGYTFLSLQELYAWWRYRRIRTFKTHKRREPRLIRDAISDAQINFRGRSKWLATDVDPFFIVTIFADLILFAYFISTTELIILKTGGNQHANDWGFGQVFAVMVVTPSVVALYRGIKGNTLRPRRRDQHPTLHFNEQSFATPSFHFNEEGLVTLDRAEEGNTTFRTTPAAMSIDADLRLSEPRDSEPKDSEQRDSKQPSS